MRTARPSATRSPRSAMHCGATGRKRHELVSTVGVNRVLPIFGSDIVPCGAKGSRTPDLLHAMQQEQRSGLGLDGFYLDLQCTGVPVSACKSVRVGCPLGCPLVSDRILLTQPASVAQQF